MNDTGEDLLFCSAGDHFKSVVHYYLFGNRKVGPGSMVGEDSIDQQDFGEDSDDDDSEQEQDEDDNPRVPQLEVLHRLHWLHQRKLVDSLTKEDWKDLVALAGKSETDFETFSVAKIGHGWFARPFTVNSDEKGND